MTIDAELEAASASAIRHVPAATSATVHQVARLRGELWLPGDKSISHRALLLAALAEGDSLIEGSGDGGDVRSTAGIIAALGATVQRTTGDGRTVDYRVHSPGAGGLHEPDDVLDCGNSGTSLRLATGLLVGLHVTAVLTGDASLRRRPVARIIEPLRSMGAELHARRDDTLPPVTVVGRGPLRAVDVTTSVPSAQVKSAILLAALGAEGRTTVREAIATRDHTERMLRARGVAVARGAPTAGEASDATGAAWSLEGGAPVRATTERVPGDVSAAAFWLVAGAIHPDAELTLRAVGVNPTRRTVIDVLRRMGAEIEERPERVDDGIGEPTADLTVRSSRLTATELSPAETAAAIDEIPVLALAATQAAGTSIFRGAGELRHKESDRLTGVCAALTALGATVVIDGDDLWVSGPSRLRGVTVDSLDDHRLAMTFAVAGLIASGSTSVSHPSSAAISYPGFFAELERVRS